MSTIIACSTPLGHSGVAMIRISGPKSWNIVEKMAPKARLKHSQAVVGTIRKEDQSLLDQVVLLAFKGPQSFTGLDTVEISCHGNPLIIDAILDLGISLGARPARKGEFTRQAVENGKLSLLKAEALHEVIHAGSLDGIALAQQGLAGKVDQHEEHLRQSLLEICAQLEAEMDYPQEDILVDSEEIIIEKLHQLSTQSYLAAQSYRENQIRLHGAKVALLGPVNAGKSSLFNHLVGMKRAIVSDRPGTTRDIVERRIFLDGLEVCFFDTAGARFDSDDPIENEGIQMGLELAKEADLCLFLCPSHQNLGVIEELQEALSGIPSLLIATHIDLNLNPSFAFDIAISNTTGQGILELKNSIRTLLGSSENKEQQWIALSQRQQEIFYGIAEHIDIAIEALSGFLGPVVASEELTQALEKTALLRGENAREMILDQLFSMFCIGK